MRSSVPGLGDGGLIPLAPPNSQFGSWRLMTAWSQGQPFRLPRSPTWPTVVGSTAQNGTRHIPSPSPTRTPRWTRTNTSSRPDKARRRTGPRRRPRPRPCHRRGGRRSDSERSVLAPLLSSSRGRASPLCRTKILTLNRRRWSSTVTWRQDESHWPPVARQVRRPRSAGASAGPAPPPPKTSAPQPVILEGCYSAGPGRRARTRASSRDPPRERPPRERRRVRVRQRGHDDGRLPVVEGSDVRAEDACDRRRASRNW